MIVNLLAGILKSSNAFEQSGDTANPETMPGRNLMGP
jgi:hypothetical protein